MLQLKGGFTNEKIVSLMLVMGVLLIGSFVYAASEVNEAEVTERAQQIEAMCYENGLASAFITDENGEETPLEVTYTVEAVPGMQLFSMGTTYTVTATVKTLSNSADVNNSEIAGSLFLSIEWTDNFGTGNVLNSFYLHNNITKGSFYKSEVSWGPLGTTNRTTKQLGTKTAHTESDINWTSTDPLLGSILVRYKIEYGNKQDVTVEVFPWH